MEEKTMTPEQHEMEVYESYLECFGEEDAILVALDAMDDAGKVFETVTKMMGTEDAPLDNPAVQGWVRRYIADVQISMNMMELIFGDTSDEACKLLHGLAESLHDHGAM